MFWAGNKTVGPRVYQIVTLEEIINIVSENDTQNVKLHLTKHISTKVILKS